jgi:hypothetical protein
MVTKKSWCILFKFGSTKINTSKFNSVNREIIFYIQRPEFESRIPTYPPYGISTIYTTDQKINVFNFKFGSNIKFC